MLDAWMLRQRQQTKWVVYGTLSAILALVYFGLIFGLQYLLRGIINQNNDVAIVVSTLAIAALFQPLRRRIQRLIDRRFYRRKYDAARTLAAFSATLHDEVDIVLKTEYSAGTYVYSFKAIGNHNLHLLQFRAD